MNPLSLLRALTNVAGKIINPLFKRCPRITAFLEIINDRLTIASVAIFNAKLLRSIKATDNISGKFGVNIAGYLTAESGVGEGARANIRAIEKASVSFALNNISSLSRKGDNTYNNLIQTDNPYVFNLIHANPDAFLLFLQEKSIDYLAGRYNIGFWYWELINFPDKWLYCFSYLNEIWVASDFILESISKVSPVPVVKIPPSIVVGKIKDANKSYFGLNEKSFIFFFMFDFLSHFERKNPMAILKAFKTVFMHEKDTLLVLKCSNSEYNSKMRELLFKEAHGLNVRFIDGYLQKDEINALMSLSDCYISLHRSEGFGLPLAEAMCLGKPVIATGYSGNTDFMNSNNSFPVKYKLVEIDKDYGPYKKGKLWAEPDVEHAAELMRLVYENRDMARRIGEKASEDIKRNFSPETTGRMIANRLEHIIKERNITIHK